MKRIAAAALLFSSLQAFAQAPATCERKADAPEWMPCGPDRTLSGADIKQYITRENMVAKLLVKGGTSGRMFFMDLHPDGKMAAGIKDGADIGKSWTLEGDKLCRNYYQVYRGPQCGSFELKEGVLYVIDTDNSRSPVTDIKFVPK